MEFVLVLECQESDNHRTNCREVRSTHEMIMQFIQRDTGSSLLHQNEAFSRGSQRPDFNAAGWRMRKHEDESGEEAGYR